MSDLRDGLGVDKSVASRVARAIRSKEAGSAVRELPGAEMLERLVARAEELGAGSAAVAAARAAIEDLDVAIRGFPGDRTALLAAVAGRAASGQGAAASPARQRAARRGAYDAFLFAQGIACETTSCITILGPGSKPGMLHQAMVIATSGLRRLRRGNPYAVLSLQGNPASNAAYDRTTLSGAPLLEDPTIALIPEFCSPAASHLLLERRGKYLSLVLEPTVPALDQPMDLAYGLVNLDFESSRATDENRWTQTSYTVSRPCRLHVRELLLHRGTFGGCVPEVVFSVEAVPMARPEMTGPDRTGRGAVDQAAGFVAMGRGYATRGKADEDFVVPMGRRAFELMGRDPSEYDRYRMVIEYPLPFVRGEVWVRLPE